MALNQSGLSVSLFWVVYSASLILLMQGGFAALEAGLARPKNAAHLATTKLVTVLVAALVFWVCGYAFLFGTTAGGILGTSGFFLGGRIDAQPAALVRFAVHIVFAATCANVFLGALGERLRFEAFLALTFVVAALMYPVFGHWAWAGVASGHPVGWLGHAGFVDFAGATTVHSLGGWAALAGLLVVGNRRGRYAKSGKRLALAGSSVPLAMLGLFIVWLGFLAWMGGQAQQAMEAVPRILLATIVSSSAAGATMLVLGLVRGGAPSIETVIRSILAGLVAISGGAHAMGAPQAFVVGVVAAFVLLGVDRLLERRRIDDAIGAVSVHLGGGLWGTIAVAVLGEPARIGTGLSLPAQLGAQLEGALACAVWGFGVAFAACKVIALLGPLRVSPEEEYVGLDVSEHQAATERMDVGAALEEAARHESLSVARGEPFAELAVIRYDVVGVITSANPIASAIFGYGEAEFKKIPVTALFAPIRDEPLDLDSLQASVDATPREMRGLRRTGEDFEMEVSLGTDAEHGGSIVVRDITARKESEAGFTHTTEAIKRRLGLELEETRITAGFGASGDHEIPGGDVALFLPPGTDWFGAYHDGDGRAVTLYGGELMTEVSSTSALLSSVLAGGGYMPGAEDTHGLLLGDSKYPPERQLRNLADVLNRIVSREGRGEVLLAMTFIHVDLGTGHVTIANAGRRAPTLVKSGRTVRDVAGGGSALGYAGDADLQVTSLSLGPGDLLILCGEGMIDTISPDGTVLRGADLKKRILGRQTARDVLHEIAMLSATVWRGTHDQHPVLAFGWKPVLA